VDWTHLLASAMGAILGGIITAAGSWTAINTKVGNVETALNSLTKSVITCQTEREQCRRSMRDHHEDTNNHVGDALMTIITDIQSRIVRIETKLMNGSYKG
jgi:hypothetical protein